MSIRAIQKDPNYALAYAGLANSYIPLGHPGVGVAPKDALLQAQAAATKALTIDDSLGEGALGAGARNRALRLELARRRKGILESPRSKPK